MGDEVMMQLRSTQGGRRDDGKEEKGAAKRKITP
jgi:hypothetical protein